MSNYCEFCFGGKALVIGKANDVGIAIQYPNRLIAYGYDIHETGSNGIYTRIHYCPMCGRRLSSVKREEKARDKKRERIV